MLNVKKSRKMLKTPYQSIFWPQILFLSPPPRSRMPVFFPNFSRTRARTRVIMTKMGAKRRLFWLLPSQKLQNDFNWEEIWENWEEIWEIWEKNIRRYIFHIQGNFFFGFRSCFLPNFLTVLSCGHFALEL